MKKVRFLLAPAERNLILKYGYPFEDLEAALIAAKGNRDSIEIEMEEFWFEHLLGELARSINHSKSQSLMERLNHLYEYLESEGRDCGLNINY